MHGTISHGAHSHSFPTLPIQSTKLVHGGVRYLEKAVFNLDYSQLKLVYEALHERLAFLRNAPHLAHPLPILTVSCAEVILSWRRK